jgi:sugar phosphate isomerase/epimerase
MQTRRDFIKTVVMASMAGTLAACAKQQKHQLEHFGFISGILKNELQNGDWKAVLREAVSYGFSEYEGGLLGESPQEFLVYSREIGLKPVAGGIAFSEDMELVQHSLDKIKTLDMPYAITYWPWFSGGPFTLDECKRSAELLNKIGALAKENELTFCWHNHNKEFWQMEEGLPFDYLMQNTDTDLVKCELDIYWVKKGGADPLAILKQYAGRIPILHVKDMAPGEAQDFACPGSGMIDFPSIFAEAFRQGITHYFVERDNVEDGLACLKSSGEYLKNLSF